MKPILYLGELRYEETDFSQGHSKFKVVTSRIKHQDIDILLTYSSTPWYVFVCVCVCMRVYAQLCLTVCNPMHCNPSSSSVHSIS